MSGITATDLENGDLISENRAWDPWLLDIGATMIRKLRSRADGKRSDFILVLCGSSERGGRCKCENDAALSS